MEYEKYLSERAKTIPPSGIRKFFDVVSEMEGAISLGVGEPDFITPWNIRDAGIRSVQKGYTQYTSNSGLPKLREKIAEYLSTRFSLNFEPNSEIIVTVGASEAIDISLRALLNPEDEVLIPEPSFVSYAPCVTLCGGNPIPIPCFAENKFKLMPDDLERAITPRTKLLLISYPNNPTGAVMEREYLEQLVPIIEKHDLIVLTDEIYCELTYGTKHVSIASLPNMRERTIVINGFSKAFAMTGWRLGYVCAPKVFTKVMLKIHQYAIMSAPTMSQYAALTALEQGLKDDFSVVRQMTEQYNMRRRFMVSSLNDMGLKCFEPKGAFYVFPEVSSVGQDGQAFAKGLLESQKVAVVPGDAFGQCGTNFVRMSYAYSMKNLDIAISRIRQYVQSLRG